MHKPMAWNELVDVISSDEDSDMEVLNESGVAHTHPTGDTSVVDHAYEDITPEDALTRRAEMYQEYMKQIPIPQQRGSVIPFTSWTGLGMSIKKLYGQPLHYLTNILLKQWDQLRIGSEEEYIPLDMTMHPVKAEAAIWLAEEVHRRTSSHHHIAKLWLSDPMHHSCVDSFPQLGNI